MRKGFSLLTAIFVMLLIGSVLYLTLTLAAKATKQTADIYLKEQARLLARSATEYELLRISGFDFSGGGCYTGENYTFEGIDVNATIRYIGNNFPASCALAGANAIQTIDSNGTILLDIVVSYTDPSTGEQVRFHRRTIQKP